MRHSRLRRSRDYCAGEGREGRPGLRHLLGRRHPARAAGAEGAVRGEEVRVGLREQQEDAVRPQRQPL
jgi:hypothetical protein